MKNKKIIILVTLITGILITTIGVTYSLFSNSIVGKNSDLIAGDIYMHYNEVSKGVKLENAMPSLTYDATNYFEFTIDGKNTYLKKDIYYEVVLSYGEEIQNKTRIKDNLLKFRLTEVTDNDETELFTDRSFSDLTNKRIWVETIPKGTNSEILKRYRLYMWLSNDTIICGGDETENCDYYIDKEPYWENVYASIKVGVNGDFEEKTLATDASCFTTEYDYESATVNSVMTSQTYQEPPTDNRNELSKCMDYFKDTSFDDGSTNETYCKGTGTLNDETFQEGIDSKNITLSNYLIDNNIVKVTGRVITITNYDDTCEKDVVIPSSIDGIKVTAIGGVAFFNKELTSVIIPNTVITIHDRIRRDTAFGHNNLKEIVIPDSVKTIGILAFSDNQLTKISIGRGVTEIRNYAFVSNELTSLVVPEGVTTIGTYAFEDNKLKNVKLPSSLSTIGQYAFENNQLETFEIPNGLTELTDFLGNNPLKSITFQENSKITEIKEGFISDNGIMWQKYQNLESIEIPNSVTYIAGNNVGAFDGLNLKEIIFEDNSKLTEISDFTFANLKLVSVNIPNGVTIIGRSAFSGNKLTSIEIPDSVTTIGSYAFSSNQLASVTIGNGIQYIGKLAFSKSSSSNQNLSKITINKSCNDIKNIQGSSTDTTKYYPWLSFDSPYTASGVTIYGSNNEICDSF